MEISLHPQDIVRKFEQALGNRAPQGLEMLRILQREMLPFTALDGDGEETMYALVQAGYASPDSWCRVYCIQDLGLQVLGACKV